jgi:uncharacterized membrane protein HdeD (DUF308 family)
MSKIRMIVGLILMMLGAWYLWNFFLETREWKELILGILNWLLGTYHILIHFNKLPKRWH